jgi:hypothetical protein
MNRTLIAMASRFLLCAGLIALLSTTAFAQTSASSTPVAQPHETAPGDTSLATPIGHELSVGIGGYRYTEPGDQSISIHGSKIGGGYLGTRSLNRRQHWFAQADVRGTVGNTTYDGWCSPYLIIPNSASPNGYELDVGDASPCSETGDKDWYVEARALFGKDFIGRTWALSPNTGLGLRHLSNGITGVAGYRTDNYLYLPLGLTARTKAASHALSFNVEYDRLLHGWQKTRDSDLGGGDIPPTATAPGFTIEGFTDISFAQHDGWALRANATYQATRHWSVEPSFIHWSVDASPVNYETATFTVNNVTVDQQVGAYEPVNATNELVVKLGYRF